MFEKLNFQGKMWKVSAKVNDSRIDEPSTLREIYGADMVIRNNQNIYFILDEIIDVEYEDV